MYKKSKYFRVFLSFLFLFSLVFFIASEHPNPDCGFCPLSECDDFDLSIVNNTPSEVMLTLTSSSSQVIKISSKSKINFTLKKGIYTWKAIDVKTQMLIGSGIVNMNDSDKKILINSRK